MLYIKKLIICDQYDQEIFKLEHAKAIDGLQKALSIVMEKDGEKSFKQIIKKYISQLDKEFQDYFNMGEVKP